MQVCKRQRIEPNLDPTKLIPVIDYLDYNCALKLRCVARSFIKAAIDRLLFLFPKVRLREAYNLVHSGILSLKTAPICNWTFSTCRQYMLDEFCHQNCITPFMKMLVQNVRTKISHKKFAAPFIWNFGYQAWGPELLAFSERLDSPNEPNIWPDYMNVFCTKILHENWNTLRNLPLEVFTEEMYFVIGLHRPVFVKSFPLLFRTAALCKCIIFYHFLHYVEIFPLHLRKELHWPKESFKIIRQTKNVTCCWLFLEFFTFTQKTALKWLRLIWENRWDLDDKIELKLPTMIELAFADENGDWLLMSETDFIMVHDLLRFEERLLTLGFSQSSFKRGSKILQLEHWPGKCRVTQ